MVHACEQRVRRENQRDRTTNVLFGHVHADLIDYGEITVGVIDPVGCVVTATDGSNCLAMLARRDGETFSQLMIRLDLAIARAFVDDIFTDEVNVPPRKK